ncbi:sugar nucleotide-binding protein [Azospirillum sp. INR13]|uniref:SDR family oxidoreductase n=1 Tax=Azospirillum sp. INR13 TaxID=2596919 RepID=UPI00189263B3|nr:sugar nucleotide-binding protein [Azospirillum sp. INR13]MBF5093543.1 sugar nucleotide-binding protein [Azospirillum sp. INR13]
MGRDRLLVLGGSGIIGRALARRLGPERVVLTGRSRTGSGVLPFDAATDDAGRLIDGLGPLDAVVLMFGITSPDACARDPEAAHQINVEAMERAVLACASRGVPVAFLSSEVVFDGRRGNYREDDRPAPLMLYGRQKLAVEEIIAREAEGPHRLKAVIARCARVVGTRPGDGTLVTDLLERLARGETLRVAADQRFSPILDDDAADALATLLNRGRTGIVHLAGPEAAGRLEIAERCRRRLRDTADGGQSPLEIGRIEATRMRDFPTLEPRPQDVSLSIRRLTEFTELALVGINEMIERCLSAQV